MANEDKDADKDALASKHTAITRRFIRTPLKSSDEQIKAPIELYSLDWTLGFMVQGTDEYNSLKASFLPDVGTVNFDRDHFLNLLAGSFSLNRKEKQRVLDTFIDTGLSDYQIKELIKTFESERTEFKKLISTENRHICGLYFKALGEWSQIVFGHYLCGSKLQKICEDLINEDTLISKELKRDQNFWEIAVDFAINWNVSPPVIKGIVEKGLEFKSDKYTFPLRCIDSLYKTKFNNLEDRFFYLTRRSNSVRQLLLEFPTDDRFSIVVARAWVLGLCSDYVSLNKQELAFSAIEQAELALATARNQKTALPENSSDKSEELQRANAKVLSWKVNLLAMFTDKSAELFETIKKIEDGNAERLLDSYSIDALYYKFQFKSATHFLKKNFDSMTKEGIPEEELFSDHIADSAIELLSISVISGEKESSQIASEFLIGFCQYQSQSNRWPHSADHKRWICIYRVVRLLKWIGRADISHYGGLIETIHSDFNSYVEKQKINFFPFIDDENKLSRASSMRAIPPIQLAIMSMDGQLKDLRLPSGMWQQSITDRRILFQTLVVLFAISSNELLRKNSQELAKDMLKSRKSDLFGPQLKWQFSMLERFADGLTHCGMSEPFAERVMLW